MEYHRDVPRALGDEAIVAESAHVMAHLSAVADADDDPDTHAGDVLIDVIDHPDDPSMVRIVGRLDAEPDAPYLKPDYDPWENVDHELFEEQIAATLRDELEVNRGSH